MFCEKWYKCADALGIDAAGSMHGVKIASADALSSGNELGKMPALQKCVCLFQGADVVNGHFSSPPYSGNLPMGRPLGHPHRGSRRGYNTYHSR